MASIQQRRTKDGQIRYRVQVRLKGFPLVTASFPRKTDARIWAQETESAIRQGRFFKVSEAKRRTFREATDRYVREILPEKPKSEKQQTGQLRWWRKRLGDKVLSDITNVLIIEQRDALARQTSPANSNRYMAVLSHLFTVCVKRWGWVEPNANPFLKIERLKEPRGRIRFLSDQERAALLKACRENPNPHLYDAVVLALSTGCRKREIMHLRWPNVDLDRGQIILHDTKNDERRSVPLTGHGLERMGERSRVRRLDCDYVFPQEKQPKPADIDRDFTRARDAAGIRDFRFHDLRHSAASALAMNGATLAEIAEVLGHKTLAMVKRYAHLSEAHTSKVVERMNAAIFGAGEVQD